MSLSELKELLTCCICMETVTLPVHSTCCENTKSLAPACLVCVRNYLQLNKPCHTRPDKMKGWNGCGCDIYSKPMPYKHYTHTYQLDTIRNLLGPSTCPHKCGVSCNTSAELRRHLNGTSNKNDGFKNCPEAMTTCKYKCGFFGKRRIVEGEHFEEKHAFVFCMVCKKNIKKRDVIQHYREHEASLTMFKRVIEKEFKQKIEDVVSPQENRTTIK